MPRDKAPDPAPAPVPAPATDYAAVARAVCAAHRQQLETNRQLLEALERLLPPEPERHIFVATPFQLDILAALKNKALRTDALSLKLDCSSNSKLFKHPGGIHELQEHGLVAWQNRLGFYRPDAPPPELDAAENG